MKEDSVPKNVEKPQSDQKTPRKTTGANLIFKAIEVLEVVTSAATPPRLIDIVKTTGLPTGTAHRILESLISERFLRRDDSSRTYQLGSRFLQMARGAWEDYDVRSAAVPELDKLQTELGQTITLSVLVDGKLIVIERRKSKDSLRSTVGIGSMVPLHCTSSGKAILSTYDAEKLSEVDLVPVTTNTITDPTALRAQLEMAASNHFAIDDEESALGVRGCAAAIINEAGKPLGALSFTGPAEIVSVARCRQIGPLLAKSAERVSWNLGFNPPERWTDLAVSRRIETVERVGTALAFVGANPVWSRARKGLYWSDRTHPAIRFNGEGGSERSYSIPARAQGFIETDDALLMVLPDGLYRLDLDTEKVTKVNDLIGSDLNQSYVTSTCDAQGRLWISTMDSTLSRATGRIYRIDKDFSQHCMVKGLLMPGGIAWSPDNDKIYYSDGPKREIYCADFDQDSGSLGERRVFVRIPEGTGRPTGIAVDREGYLWNTQSEGWRVIRYSPDGAIDHVLELPVSRPLDCGFGGPDMKTLFITSTRLGIPERRLAELPLSGALLAYRTKTPGLPKYKTAYY
jgi:DNA-binding IclR family transcriptional regulator/sugar lactone lactonase YvrE